MNKQLLFAGLSCLAATTLTAAPAPQRLEAEKADFDPARMEVVERPRFSGKAGAMLKADAKSRQSTPAGAADLTFKFTITEPGRYWVTAAADSFGKAREAMKKANNKYDSLRIMISVDGDFARNRVLVEPWRDQDFTTVNLEKYNFTAGEHEIKVWLPEGVGLDRLDVRPYNPPKVPEAVLKYRPAIVPPAQHPRLWVTRSTLDQVRANLTKGENAAAWAEVKAEAAKPFTYTAPAGKAAEHNVPLQKAATYKAFVYLMTGDRELGLQAVKLMTDYLAAVEFGNMLDITRELGSALYAGAQVYDWCYELMTVEERNLFAKKLMVLAEDMEIGWPPFLQSVVNGHGNEYQVNRDLLAVAIALYGDDNVPYQYCSYRMLEELLPLRAIEYQSNRHNQGISYAAFRFAAEMHAVWLMRRLADREVFDPSIKTLGLYWAYMRAPNGEAMLDGDGSKISGYWQSPMTTFLGYTYAADPMLKAEFEKEGGSIGDPVLFLLLNDPSLKPENTIAKLPLTHYFKGVLPSMVARTGWNIGPNSSDVVVEMKGGDTHFGNHQHADAGSFQIYYRGDLATDLGMYAFYGTPYDYGFNKRSIAHNVMLVYDPAEKPEYGKINDGGQRFLQRNPVNVETLKNPLFKYGTTLSADFGPDKVRPYYSYLKSDLKAAYTDKISYYTRTFCFLNMDNIEIPGVLITLDRVTSAKPEFKKYFLLNSFTKPAIDGRSFDVTANRSLMPGKLSVSMLLPKDAEVTTRGGAKELHTYFGQTVTPPVMGAIQANGYRTMVTPAAARGTDTFLAVMQIGQDEFKPLPVKMTENDENVVLSFADRVVVLGTSEKAAAKAFSFEIGKERASSQVLLADLAPGSWTLKGDALVSVLTIVDGKNTAWLELPAGRYTATPGAPAVPVTANLSAGKSEVGGKRIDKPENRVEGKELLAPALEVARMLGGKVEAGKGTLKLVFGKHTSEFKVGEAAFSYDGTPMVMRAKAIEENGAWFIPAYVLAGIGNALVAGDLEMKSAFFVARKKPSEILWIDSNCAFTEVEWEQVTHDFEGKTQYWATNGSDRTFTVAFTEPRELEAIGMRWSQGNSRVAKFKLEICDGKNWKTVHDGDSFKMREVELYKFPKQTVREIRFTGYGNSVNTWNSIISFLPVEAK